MKILSANQIRALDQYTIQNEPISSLDLMERASMVFTNWFTQNFDYKTNSIHIFCGPGNNGGDGLAIGRLLYHSYYDVKIYLCNIAQPSEDFIKNLHRLPRHQAVPILEIEVNDPIPNLPENAIIIDAIFGSGLNRSVSGYWAQLIEQINQQSIVRVAVDIPSGLFADQHSEGDAIIRAHKTFCFELPKLAFLFPENNPYVGQWNFASIGLLPEFIASSNSTNQYIDSHLAKSFLKERSKFTHKGTFGHTLMIAGSYGMIGAALLSSKAALRSGTGLVTLHAPKVAYAIVQGTIPEVIVSIDENEHFISKLPNLAKYQAIGIGSGIGINDLSTNFLKDLIVSNTLPLVLDADALNILAQHPDWLAKLPANSILTPHPKEFERLFGKAPNDFARNELQRKKAAELGIFILLKGAHSCIACPDGTCYFNSTGNPGMATGGSGDVLTGMITSLMAQGYSAKEAVVLGTYLHGLAGDLALEKIGSEEALIAGDLVDFIGQAFGFLKGVKR